MLQSSLTPPGAGTVSTLRGVDVLISQSERAMSRAVCSRRADKRNTKSGEVGDDKHCKQTKKEQEDKR